jgi:L-amino acid N-acyltransferase YncA
MIREVRLSDAQAIADIYRHHVLTGTATFEIEPPTITETAAKIEKILAQKSAFLVIEADGKLAGYAYATPFRDRPAYIMTCEDSIYLHPDQMGKGFGSQLLSALIDAAEAVGFRQIIGVVGGGEPASVALHVKFGFEHRGTMKSVGRKFGLWLDTVYMQRAIGAGDTSAPEIEP